MLLIEKNEIRQRIPHAGGMCLIDGVREWDQGTITCISHTHVDTKNPLRHKNKLPMSTLIEYGAQAMAIHGSLLNEQQGEPQGGYLAGLKGVRLAEGDLSCIRDKLVIFANKIYSDGKNMIYDFSVSSGEIELASGRATVFGGVVTGEEP